MKWGRIDRDGEAGVKQTAAEMPTNDYKKLKVIIILSLL